MYAVTLGSESVMVRVYAVQCKSIRCANGCPHGHHGRSSSIGVRERMNTELYAPTSRTRIITPYTGISQGFVFTKSSSKIYTSNHTDTLECMREWQKNAWRSASRRQCMKTRFHCHDTGCFHGHAENHICSSTCCDSQL